jgi:hypothetical protein
MGMAGKHGSMVGMTAVPTVVAKLLRPCKAVPSALRRRCLFPLVGVGIVISRRWIGFGEGVLELICHCCSPGCKFHEVGPRLSEGPIVFGLAGDRYLISFTDMYDLGFSSDAPWEALADMLVTTCAFAAWVATRAAKFDKRAFDHDFDTKELLDAEVHLRLDAEEFFSGSAGDRAVHLLCG